MKIYDTKTAPTPRRVRVFLAEKKLKEQFIERLPDEKFKTQDAEKIADDIGVKRKSVFNYLKDYRVERLEHGVYQKKQLNGTTA